MALNPSIFTFLYVYIVFRFQEIIDNLGPSQCPLVYSENYNVRFGGLEKLHPFDAAKWRNIFEYLKEMLNINENNIVAPQEITTEDLLMVHSKSYLNSLKWGWNVAAIAEIPLLALMPNFLIQSCYLRPMRCQTGGTIVAGMLALEKGWAVNIGGGFHHCSRDRGGGFCPYADITLLVEYLLKNKPTQVHRVMVVDLDAHQGNGYARDFLRDERIFIMDVYNKGIYPQDEEAKGGISCKVELDFFTEDSEYLDKVERNLEQSLRRFHPDIIIYNAGTDILEGDTLGKLSITREGIIRRDEIVFMKARERRVPIVLLTSGGYLKRTARIIADSIGNLFELGLISRDK
ncbi:hypothetical protein AAG570_007931 [Ranatra chinensis]|uniref:Histone deacetylase 11 n=1 Tax=Ranatra chinensis TaxID=642074 RepID=A0ABD0XV85_9HEMI